jgi:hypothetical protein
MNVFCLESPQAGERGSLAKAPLCVLRTFARFNITQRHPHASLAWLPVLRHPACRLGEPTWECPRIPACKS